MKKFIAVLMAMLMMLCMVTAYADETDDTVHTGSFTKRYTGALPVGDVLNFKVEFVKEMASGSTEAPNPPLISVLPHTVISGDNLTNTITYSYIKPAEYGSYVYKITEVAPETQGYVTYDKGALYIMVNYLVIDGTEQLYTSVCTDPSLLNVPSQIVEDNNNDGKNDQFVNEYAVGGFDITKTITGNAAVMSDKFVIDVVLTSDRNLEGLSMSFTQNETVTTIKDITSLTKDVPVTVQVTIGDGETISFAGVPQGVNVTVTEIKQNGKDDLNNYKPTYTNQSIVVGATNQTISIVNDKSAIIPTGVYMDYIPYVVLLAVAVVAIVAIVAKRRSGSRDDD